MSVIRVWIILCFSIAVTIPCGIINCYSRLNIVAEYIKAYSFSFVLDRISFHFYTFCNKIISFKNRCNSIHDMIRCFFYIVCNHIFKWKHSYNVKVSCSCYKILFVGILTCQLISYKMTSVIQILSIYKIILNSVPSCRLNHSDFTTLFCRHNVTSYTCNTYCTSSKFV